MTIARKLLGQTAAASTEVALYSVPASTEVVVTAVVFANRSAAPANIRIATVPNGGVTGNEDYVLYDHPIKGFESFPWTVPITMDASDVLRVETDTATVSVSAYGMEIT
jgi:hypothetical protein